MHKRLLVSVAALVVTALPLAAQAQDKPAVFTIGGGYTAPNAEVSMFPWKEPNERIPLAVRHIRSFLRAHRPASV